MKINFKHTRAKLMEGRNKGISLGFVKQIKKNVYETVCECSPCKDYMNDFVWVETRKKPLGKIYGFEHKLINLFKETNFMVAQCYSDQKNNAMMMDNMKNIQKFMNNIEKHFDIKFKTKVTKVDDKTLLVEISNEWCKEPYMISLHGLMFRIAVKYDGKQDFIEYLKTKNMYDHSDWGLINPKVIKNIAKIKKNGIIPHPYSTDNPKSYDVHNYGIVGVIL